MGNMTIVVMMIHITCHEVVFLYDILELFFGLSSTVRGGGASAKKQRR